MNKQNASLSNGGIESILIDDWYVVTDLESMCKKGRHRTRLFDVPICIEYGANCLSVIREDSNVKLPFEEVY